MGSFLGPLPPDHSVRKPGRNLDVVINEERDCVRRRVFDTLREDDAHGVDVQELRRTAWWRTNQRNVAEPVSLGMISLRMNSFLIPVIVGLRVECLPEISHK